VVEESVVSIRKSNVIRHEEEEEEDLRRRRRRISRKRCMIEIKRHDY